MNFRFYIWVILVCYVSPFFVTLGGVGDFDESAQCVRSTSDGGFVLTGYTKSYGSGNEDILLAKLNSTGNVSWVKVFGGSGIDIGNGVEQTNDGGYIVTGKTTSYGGVCYLFLAKFDQDGEKSFFKTWGSSSGCDEGKEVKQTMDGGYIITGNHYKEGCCGNEDTLVIKFNNNGSVNWTVSWGDTPIDGGNDAVEGVNGEIVAVGYFGVSGSTSSHAFITKLSPNGTWVPLPHGGFGNDLDNEPTYAYSVTTSSSSSSSYVVTGCTKSPSVGHGGWDIFLVKFDETGSILWSKIIGGSLSECAYQVVEVGEEEEYMIGGYTNSFSSTTDIILMKFDSLGEDLWSKIFVNVTSSDNALSMDTIMKKNEKDVMVVLSGITDGFGARKGDAFIVTASNQDGEGGCGWEDWDGYTVSDWPVSSRFVINENDWVRYSPDYSPVDRDPAILDIIDFDRNVVCLDYPNTNHNQYYEEDDDDDGKPENLLWMIPFFLGLFVLAVFLNVVMLCGMFFPAILVIACSYLGMGITGILFLLGTNLRTVLTQKRRMRNYGKREKNEYNDSELSEEEEDDDEEEGDEYSDDGDGDSDDDKEEEMSSNEDEEEPEESEESD